MIIIFKTVILLMGIGFLLLILLVMGETYAMNNTHPKFTIWWRKHIIGNENKLK